MSDNFTDKFLVGNNAFYKQPDYLTKTQSELAKNELNPVAYKVEIEHKIIRIARVVFAIVVFPVGIYYVVHVIVGKFVVPASIFSKHSVTNNRKSTDLDGNWKYKRIMIEVDGIKIDAMIVGKASTFNNGRWVLGSNGNCEFYEDRVSSDSTEFKRILTKVESNAILFNYPGCGSSTWTPTRSSIEKSYRAMLQFLEDDKNGIGAKEIIGCGLSIGGGAQGDALRNHTLKTGKKYVFVKNRTFSNLEITISTMMGRPLGFLAKVFGWNMDSIESSKKLQAPEIVIQTANVQECEELKDSSKIIDDEVIYPKASLAKALLDDPAVSKTNKVFIGINENHNTSLRYKSIEFLAKKINELMAIA